METSLVSKSMPRVLIVYNEPVLPPDHPESGSESDVLETVMEVEKALPSDSYVVERFGYARRPQALLAKLEEWKPDVVFNLFEGEADRTATEVYHTGLLEWLRAPFTGSSAATLALGRDKIRTKYLLLGAGLPTAAFRMVDAPGVEWPRAFPVIVKPAFQDASVGIDQGSVVTSQEQLNRRIEQVLGRFGAPVLVEQFLPGRELHVNLFDVPDDNGCRIIRVVPPTEIRFEAGPGYWPIYSYEGKWNEHSHEYKKTPLDTGITLESPLAERVAEVCTAAYRLIGMRDYGRVDLRVTPDGTPHVLEVNPNPYLNSIALVDGLRSLGLQFPDFVQNLVRMTLARSTNSMAISTWFG
jgi:D-alanine-D-alanine ligase